MDYKGSCIKNSKLSHKLLSLCACCLAAHSEYILPHAVIVLNTSAPVVPARSGNSGHFVSRFCCGCVFGQVDEAQAVSIKAHRLINRPINNFDCFTFDHPFVGFQFL